MQSFNHSNTVAREEPPDCQARRPINQLTNCSFPITLCPMRFDLFTLFPEICAAYLQESILKRAREAGLISVGLHDIRAHAAGKHKVTDDLPYGGGGGMVMKPEPVFAAVESVLGDEAARAAARVPIILLTPQGRP